MYCTEKTGRCWAECQQMKLLSTIPYNEWGWYEKWRRIWIVFCLWRERQLGNEMNGGEREIICDGAMHDRLVVIWGVMIARRLVETVWSSLKLYKVGEVSATVTDLEWRQRMIHWILSRTTKRVVLTEPWVEAGVKWYRARYKMKRSRRR